MDKGQFIDIGDFDENTVDCNVAPQSAEHYLRQVMVSRNKCPDVVRAQVTTSSAPEVVKEVKKQERDPRAPDLKWQQDKAKEFGEKRQYFEDMRSSIKKMKIKLPSIDDEDKWKEMLLDRCHPNFENMQDQFPNHVCTPPAASLIAALTPTQINTLIPFIVEWATSESLTRPLREWLFSLMIVVDLPLLHDVVAALRDLAKMCKVLRSHLSLDRKEDITEISFFIAVVAFYFGQKDLADN